MNDVCKRVSLVTADHGVATRVMSSRKSEITAFASCAIPKKARSLRCVLDAFPITDKAFYIHHASDAFLETKRSVLLFSETSGTSGSPPLLTPRGRTDLTWNTYNQSLAYREHVFAGHDRVMLLNPSVMSPFIEGSSRALYDLGVAHMRVFPIPKICNWERIGRLINDYTITTIMSTPTLILKLLYEMDRLGVKIPSINKLLITGEHISSALIKTLDTMLGIAGATRPLIYGSSEAASVMFGRKDGDYRAFIDDFVFEILQTDFDWQHQILKTLPSNAVFGSLCISWLRDGIMPLVRFNTEDLFSCWLEATTDEYVFRSHGRALNALGLTPVHVQLIEDCLWSGEDILGKVFHYDMQRSDASTRLNTVTSTNPKLFPVGEVQQRIGDMIHQKVQVYLNPEGHSFYDEAPRAKSVRYRLT